MEISLFRAAYKHSPTTHACTCTVTQADLLDAATAAGIPVISVLGAGAKADPTRVFIADMADALKDPLAHKLRRELR